MPVLVWIAAVLVLIVAFIVRRTVFGRRLLAIGGNRAAAELAGLPVKRVLITVYVVCSVLASIAGLLAVARIQSSDASAVGLLIELSAITAVVVGGTPLTGGKVRVLGTVAGALLMQLVDRHHDQAQPAAVHDRDGAGRHHPRSPCTSPERGRPGDPDGD